MPSIKYLAISALGATILSAGTVGVVSAAHVSGHAKHSNPVISAMKQDRQSAAASILHTSTANIKTARKDKDLSKLIASAGLTKKEFNKDLRQQVLKDLEAKGYTKDQVIIAVQRMQLNHYRREDRLEHKKS